MGGGLMNIIPSMDLYKQKITRLERGVFATRKHYPIDPLTMVKRFESDGATRIHVVDLEATEKGVIAHRDLILEMVKSVKIPIQVGGGIRNFDIARDYLNHGVDTVVLGSLAIQDVGGLKAFIKEYPNRVVVALDIKNEIIMTHGWQVSSDISLWTFLDVLSTFKDLKVMITDIQTDGMLKGPNIRLYDKIKNITLLSVMASGGLTRCKDIQALKAFGVEEAILGKAMYEEILPLKEAISCSQKESSLV
jgi:phosphoribosylformimino-5-aminoimidazole carboxamide ribotide isomerase